MKKKQSKGGAKAKKLQLKKETIKDLSAGRRAAGIRGGQRAAIHRTERIERIERIERGGP